MSSKEEWLKENLAKIRNKNLQPPIRLNQATIITDIEKLLTCLEKSILHNTNKKILKVLVDQVEELAEL